MSQTTPLVRVITCDRCGRRWTSLNWASPETQEAQHTCLRAVPIRR